MTDQDTSPEAVERMAARLCTSQQPSIGQRRSIAAMLSALSAERDEMTRRRDYWKTLAEGQDFTRVYLETCAERDALKAELVSTLSAAILDAQIRVIESRQMDTPDQIRANALAFLARHQKETDT